MYSHTRASIFTKGFPSVCLSAAVPATLRFKDGLVIHVRGS